MAGTHSVLDVSADTRGDREARVAYLLEGPNRYRGLLESNHPAVSALGSLVDEESLATAGSFPALGQRTRSMPATLDHGVEEKDHCNEDMKAGGGHPEGKGNPSVGEEMSEPGHDSIPAGAASHRLFHGSCPAYLQVRMTGEEGTRGSLHTTRKVNVPETMGP